MKYNFEKTSWQKDEKMRERFPVTEFVGRGRAKNEAITRLFRYCFNCFSPYLARMPENERTVTCFCCECGSIISIYKKKNGAKQKLFKLMAEKYYGNGVFCSYTLDGYNIVPMIFPIIGADKLINNLYKEDTINISLSYITKKKPLLGFHRDNNEILIGEKKACLYLFNYLNTLSTEEQKEWVKFFKYCYTKGHSYRSRYEQIKRDYKKQGNKQRAKAFAAKETCEIRKR